MSLRNYSHDEIKQIPMLELAEQSMMDANKTISFKELFDTIAEMKGLTEQQYEDYISQFYTDINMDGRFVNIGSNTWGLKRWYPVNEVMERTKAANKKTKPKKKRAVVKEPAEEIEEESEGNEMEELTGDFSKLDGEDEEDEDALELEIDTELENDDEELDEDDEIDDEESEDETEATEKDND